MTTLKELLVQKEEIIKKIEEKRASERSGAIEQAMTLIEDYQLTQLDLFGGSSPVTVENKKTKQKVQTKYRDPVTGKEWTGRGVKPKWISSTGKDKSEFLIVKPTNVQETSLPQETTPSDSETENTLTL